MIYNFKLLNLYGHTNINQNEPLLDHLNKTKEYYTTYFDNEIITSFIDNISRDNNIYEHRNLILEMFYDIPMAHDLGKINPLMQNKKLCNNIQYQDNLTDDTHSLLSALFYLDYWSDKINNIKFHDKKIKNNKIKYIMLDLVLRFSYIISRHHSYLQNFDIVSYIEDIKKLNEKVNDTDYLMFYIKDKIEINYNSFNKSTTRYKNEYDIYILIKLTYSILIASDIYATYDFYNNESIIQNRVNECKLKKYTKNFFNSPIYKGIDNHKLSNYTHFKDEDINKLRSEMCIESQEVLLRNLHKYIYYLEAPTGAGKTITSINLALHLLKNKELDKLIYVFPFNTLVDQTEGVLKDYFEDDVFVKNSTTEIKTCNNEDSNYNKDLLNYDFMHHPVTITSHVQLFNILFGNNKKDNLMLSQLMNSVIIIDEIQSYSNKKWIKIINFLNKYAKILNIKLIIMSATLPPLQGLLYNCNNLENSHVNLIENRDKYFKHNLFKNRVACNFDLLNEIKNSSQNIIDKIDDIIYDDNIQFKKKFLIEFIKTKSAYSFYEEIKNKFEGYKVYCLTSHHNKIYRKYIIDQLKGDEKVILVSTQVIEAGVDIDMDIGFKDISILDAEEQFLGRINRNCKRKGIAYFFNMDNISDVYKKDFRTEKNLLDKNYRDYLINKDFHKFYELNFEALQKKASENGEYNYDSFLHNLHNLQFSNIHKDMKLIENESVTLFIPRVILNEYNEYIDGNEILNTYCKIKSDYSINYAEKEIKLSKLKNKIQYFIHSFNIYKDRYGNKTMPQGYKDIKYGYYILENIDDYIIPDEDGLTNTYKSNFDMNKYIEFCKSGFIL